MPKRIIHGEGIWGSDKLARVEPVWARPEYANLIPLALANGVFEINPKKIWSSVYSYNRPEITVEKVEEILAAFVKAALLFIWDDPATGKQWGFWIGIDKAGRLPAASRLKKGHDSVGPTPPLDSLQQYMKQPMASHGSANGLVGSGSGSGSGSGKDVRADSSSPHESVTPQTPKPPDEKLLVVERVWAYYVQKLGKNPKQLSFTAGRKQKGLARLRECLEKEGGDLGHAEGLMRLAVDALAESPFHRGENNRKKRYDSWEKNLFKDQDQAENWLDSTGGSKRGPVPVPLLDRRGELNDAGRTVYDKAGVSMS